jgi:DNA-binding MarR family transcriptional regulator
MPVDIAQVPDETRWPPPGAVTRRSAVWVEASLVVREPGPCDRRSIHVVLTPVGHEVLERAIAAQVESIDHT